MNAKINQLEKYFEKEKTLFYQIKENVKSYIIKIRKDSIRTDLFNYKLNDMAEKIRGSRFQQDLEIKYGEHKKTPKPYFEIKIAQYKKDLHEKKVKANDINWFLNLSLFLRQYNLKIDDFLYYLFLSPEQISFMLALLVRYKKGAEKRGLTFHLTFEYLLKSNILFSPCVSCGIIGGNKKQKIAYNGIDRIDNTCGYELENLQPMCWKCNKLKGAYSKEQLSGEIGEKMVLLVEYAKHKLDFKKSL